jgi:hypothetical protein
MAQPKMSDTIKEKNQHYSRTTGWGSVRDCKGYAGVSERTFRDWLHMGLRHARLPSGRILVRFADIDTYLERFCDSANRADRIVDEIMSEVGRK